MTTLFPSGGNDEYEELAAIDRACAALEQAWLEGQKPALRDFLKEFVGEVRQVALRELLWVEWDCLRKLDGRVSLDEYRARYPEFADEIDEAWQLDEQRKSAAGRGKFRGERYRIVKPHARGGMGQVFLARDIEFDRHVALKEIHPHQCRDQAAQERFLREVQITGMLEHPGIVPVYGRGQNADGSPFYAMRFVQGDSLQAAILDFHARNGSRKTVMPTRRKSTQAKPGAENGTRPSAQNGSRSSSRTRPSRTRPSRTLAIAFKSVQFQQLLNKFLQVCNVIEYAHCHGVVHRDLKPSNIMVGPHGETLVVDWGLAKTFRTQPSPPHESPAAENRLEKALTDCTVTGDTLGTPGYMSPEQAEGKLEKIGPCSDVYSLGATLYFLLTGQSPLSGQHFESIIDHTIQGQVPSARSIQPSVPRALDAICARAMSRDPEARYGSAKAIADDIEHWLADEPVSVLVESLPSRANRWIRKHQTLVSSGAFAAILTSLAMFYVSGVIASSNQELVNARREADQKRLAAEMAESTAAKGLHEAQTESNHAKSVTDFMVGNFRPTSSRSHSATVAETLHRSFDELQSTDNLDPITKTLFLDAIATSFRHLNLDHQAIEVAKHGEKLASQLLGPDDLRALSIKQTLAVSYLNNGNTTDALSALADLLPRYVREFGPTHHSTQQVQLNLLRAYVDLERLSDARDSLSNVFDTICLYHPENSTLRSAAAMLHANLLRHEGHNAHAIFLYRSELQRLITEHGDHTHRDVLDAYHLLANMYLDAGQYKDAVALHESILVKIEDRSAVPHPLWSYTRSSLAVAHVMDGNYQAGISHFTALASLLKDRYGPDHPDALIADNGLGMAYLDSGDNATALTILKDTLERRTRVLGLEHPYTLHSINNLALAHHKGGRHREARELYDRCLTICRSSFGNSHPLTLRAMNNFGTFLHDTGSVDEAGSLFKMVLAERLRLYGADHPSTLTTAHNLAGFLLSTGNLGEAIPLLESTSKTLEAKLGKNHQDFFTATLSLARGYRISGATEKAISTYQGILPSMRLRLGDDHPSTLLAQGNLATALTQRGRLPEAIELYENTYEVQVRKLGAAHSDALVTRLNLAICRQHNGDLTGSVEILEQMRGPTVAVLGWQHPATVQSHLALAACYRGLERPDDAKACYLELLDRLTHVAGADAPQTILVQRHYAGCLLQLGEGDEAIELLRRAIPPLNKRYGEHNSQVLDCTIELANALRSLKRYGEAEEYYKSIVSRCESIKGYPEMLHASNLFWLGMCELRQSKYAESELSIRRSWEKRKRLAPDDWTTAVSENVVGFIQLQLDNPDGELHLVNGATRLLSIRETIPLTDRARVLRETFERVISAFERLKADEKASTWRARFENELQ